MNYLVYCTFDLKNASSRDYDDAYLDLKSIGLTRVVVASKGEQVIIPTTSVLGTFNSTSAVDASEYVREKIKAAFASRGFRSEIFVIGASDWAWTGSTT